MVTDPSPGDDLPAGTHQVTAVYDGVAEMNKSRLSADSQRSAVKVRSCGAVHILRFEHRPKSQSVTPRESRSDGGLQRVEANARLTAGIAAVLLVLLAIEGVTVLRIGQLLTMHVVVGLLLVPPVLLKIVSTMWRFVHYYRGDPAYREKGPPPPALRVLGPFVVVLTVILFASGIALLFAPNRVGGHLLLIHKASFVLWLAVTTIHVLGHLGETGRLAPRDWMHQARRRVPGARVRQMTIATSLVIGGLLAAALVGRVNDFQHTYLGHNRGFVARSGPHNTTGSGRHVTTP